MVLGVGNSRVVVLIVCLGELLTVGILIFSQGFLLTRQVINKTSNCNDDFVTTDPFLKSRHSEGGKDDICRASPIFKKTVILLIDALRYDFAKYDSFLKDPKPYQNKMEAFESIISAQPSKARLYPFIADAPTTTMQRLKGLTTGSLPTFIDASHNFASEEITEDNIIDQLVRCGKNVTLLGDDTWGGLFPRRFHRSFLYPSFNVMDLHTVDEGVISHLADEMSRDDWDVIIGHFLGVDHCGHRYGPDHPEMAKKLIQLDSVVKDVIKNIKNDTLLLVFGDHGMTRTGDHGGDSEDEVTSAFFVYSPLLNMPLHAQGNGAAAFPSVAQVDLIPTLSMAMGVPIPYSNLGKVVLDVTTTLDQTPVEISQRHLLSLAFNVHQVSTYLREYKNQGNVFPHDLWLELESFEKEISQGFKDELPINKQKQIYERYLTLAKMMCEEIWAKFNVSEMSVGLLFSSLVIFLAGFIVVGEVSVDEETILVNRILYLTISINVVLLLCFYVAISIIASVMSLAMVCFLYFHKDHLFHVKVSFDLSDIIPICFVIFMCLGSFSNSYVVLENYVAAFFLVSMVTVQVFGSFFKQQKKKSISGLPSKLVKWASNYWGLFCMVSLSVVLVCVRICAWFWKCREEQPWCIPGQIHTAMAGLPQGLRNWRYFTSLFSLILLTWLPRRWLMMCGNMNGSGLGIVLVKKVPILCSFLVAVHWALEAGTSWQGSPLKVYGVIPPLLTYFFALFLTAIVFFVPMLIYEVPPVKTDLTPVSDNPYNCIPQLYHTLKAKYGNDNTKKPSIPIVYGLATAVTAPLIGVLTTLLIVIVMLAGDGLAPGILILVGGMASCLCAQAASAWMNAESLENVMKPTWSSVCIWFMLSVHSFYSTGHHPTFPSLHWSAAFVGFEGNWVAKSTNLIPALLVGFNTFSSHILFGFSLPLVVFCPLTLGVVFPKLRNNRLEDDDTRQGEFLFVEDKRRTAVAMVFSSTLYILLHAIKVFFSAVAAFILRRHLMVWKIFAPHFIFDAVGFIVTCFSVPLGLLFTLRVIDVLNMFSVYLRQKYS